MIKRLIFTTLLILNSVYAFAGGSSFEIKVISLIKIDNNEYHFKFIPLTTPYGQTLEKFRNGNEIMTVIIKYGCSQSLYTCLFKKRSFTKEQHASAIKSLLEQAKPNQTMTFGVMSSGFKAVPNQGGFYRSYGLFESNGIVFSYANSHLLYV
jgi:hypothetical protein